MYMYILFRKQFAMRLAMEVINLAMDKGGDHHVVKYAVRSRSVVREGTLEVPQRSSIQNYGPLPRTEINKFINPSLFLHVVGKSR